jgi:hypothetical protein
MKTTISRRGDKSTPAKKDHAFMMLRRTKRI